MDLGFVYFVFLPSIATTLLAGKAVTRFGNAVGALGRTRGRGDRHALMLSSHLCGSAGRHGSGRCGTFLCAGLATACRASASESHGVASEHIWPAISWAALSAARARSIVRPPRLDRLRRRRGASLALAALLTARLTIPGTD